MTQQNQTTLSPQQEQAAVLLASGKRVGSVAKAVGVHRVTVWEWSKTPEFQQHLNDLRRAAWRSARDRMRSNTARAAQVLGTILSDSGARAQDRIAAARVVLAAAGPLFAKAGMADAVEDRGLAPLDRPRDWTELMMATARKAGALAGHLFMLEKTPGAAWVESGLADTFPDSFNELKALTDQMEQAEAYCAALLMHWQDELDREALEGGDAAP
jgi:hypothetical protein